MEDRLTTRKRKPEGDDDAGMDKIEALCAAQEKRLKKVEDLLTELHATIARAAPPPFVKPATPKQKSTKESGGRAQPKRGRSRTTKEVFVTPDPDMDDAKDVATLLDPARKGATEMEESPYDFMNTGDGANASLRKKRLRTHAQSQWRPWTLPQSRMRRRGPRKTPGRRPRKKMWRRRRPPLPMT